MEPILFRYRGRDLCAVDTALVRATVGGRKRGQARSTKKWVVMDIECDAGCGVVPFRYRDKSFVHSLQWAIGLEISLLADDPWRVFFTTDHPENRYYEGSLQVSLGVFHELVLRRAKMNAAPLQGKDNPIAPRLYMAMELSNKQWRLVFGDGIKRRRVTVEAGYREQV